MDNSLPLVPPTPSGVRKYSPIGIASLIVSVIGAFGLCLTLGTSVYGTMTSMAAQAKQTLLQVVGFAAICSGGFGLVGLGLGIGALFQKAQNKVFSIIGLVLGALVVLALCGIIAVGLVAQGSV